jgi:TPR repeat protein
MASNFYEYAANEAAEAIRRRGQPIHSERVRISDIELGASTGRREIDVEVIDYYMHLVSAGSDTSAAYTLGVMFMQGSRFIEQDVVKAIFYLEIAAEAGNVPASGQLGYLLAQQLILKRSRREEKSNAEDITNSDNEESSKVSQNSANQDSDSEILMTEGLELKRITKLLKYASNRGDIFGQIGIGYLHFKGLMDVVSPSSVLNSKEVALKSKTESAIEKQNRNIAFAYNIFFKGQTKHPDAGFYMGEILMGRGLVKETSPNQGNLNPAEQIDVESSMHTSMEIGDDLLEPPIEFPIGIPPFKSAKNAPQPMAPDYLVVKPDPVAAVQAYAVSSQRGNLLALHRLSHLANQGLGMLKSCRTAMNGFKAVAERGDWGHELTKVFMHFCLLYVLYTLHSNIFLFLSFFTSLLYDSSLFI